ncbi:MAG: ABC transporter permease [Nitrososphaerales archaeon]
MASPILYDFKRTIRSKSVVISMAVIVALSLGIIPIINLATSPTTFSSGSTVVLGYYRSPGYHLLAYSYNTYGQPVSGAVVNLTITDQEGTHSSRVTTNSSGYSSWTIAGNPGGQQVAYVLSTSGSGVQGTSLQLQIGEVFAFNGYPINMVVDPANSSRTDVLFVYEGANGSLPTMYSVYYNFSRSLGPVVTAPNETQMALLGTPTGFATTFHLPPVPTNTALVTIGAFGPNGTNALYSSYTGSLSGGLPVSVTPNQIFTSFTASILSLVVPLMAVLVAYGSYGKDKATGVLESVLTRPVTRRGLALSRYVSILLSISVALVVTMAVMEVISKAMLGSILSPAFAAYTVVSLIVEAAAFIGIIMLLSHVLKSSGSIVGLGVGLWILLDFFWGLLILIAALALGVQIGSGNYLGLTIQSAFFNPAQFYVLVGDFLNGLSISSSFGTQTPISPATYGLTPYSIALAGVFWVLVPAGLFLYSASRRD